MVAKCPWLMKFKKDADFRQVIAMTQKLPRVETAFIGMMAVRTNSLHAH